MSKISANILRDKDGGIETLMKYPVRGSAKALINLDMVGTTTINKSLNVASVVDNTTGIATVNLTTSMVDTYHNPVLGVFNQIGNIDRIADAYPPTTSTFSLYTLTSANTNTDMNRARGAVLGDLA